MTVERKVAVEETDDRTVVTVAGAHNVRLVIVESIIDEVDLAASEVRYARVSHVRGGHVALMANSVDDLNLTANYVEELEEKGNVIRERTDGWRDPRAIDS